MGKIEKNATPTSIEWNHEYPGQHGIIHVFDINFNDGTAGQFTTTKKDQTKFKLGEEVLISVEEKEDKRGNVYTRIDKITPKPSGTSGSGYSNKGREDDPSTRASIIASVCLDCAATVILKSGLSENVKPDLIALHVLANKFYDHIVLKSTGDRQLSINYQSRLKEVVNILMDYKGLNIKSSDDILKFVDIEVSYLLSKSKQ